MFRHWTRRERALPRTHPLLSATGAHGAKQLKCARVYESHRVPLRELEKTAVNPVWDAREWGLERGAGGLRGARCAAFPLARTYVRLARVHLYRKCRPALNAGPS